jgi:hypothetical protein
MGTKEDAGGDIVVGWGSGRLNLNFAAWLRRINNSILLGKRRLYGA